MTSKSSSMLEELRRRADMRRSRGPAAVVVDAPTTLGQRAADAVAAIVGSWRFVLIQSGLLMAWLLWNSASGRPFDPFPFILLNLMLSFQAAYTAPIIMMEAKDRQRAEYDYRINLKAELEIRHLHEKVDHLLKHQWERLVEIQQIQIEILSELMKRGKNQ